MKSLDPGFVGLVALFVLIAIILALEIHWVAGVLWLLMTVVLTFITLAENRL